ncbi:MAG: hypothetical protein HQK55_12460 [Deltaproteobacteria bacterium]|nr:hypothetical protein [Deltaproteobacteria bacterium]
MSLQKKTNVFQLGQHGEELFFQKQEAEQIRKLREKVSQESDQKHRDEHKMHCFRCGTSSLVEIDYMEHKVDVCINKGCGAVHLDPGEPELIAKQGSGFLVKAQKAFGGIFK